MAGDQTSKVSNTGPRKPGGRTTPVLVPQGVLAGQPDVPLDRPVTTCGSSENSRLHLVSRTVSNGHAIFVNSGGATYVADMASRTGVLVNGKLVKDAELKTGDRVQIGKFVFRYRSPAGAAPLPPQTQSPPAAVILVGSPAVQVTGRTVIIGRRETSDIAIPGDLGVSSAHAVIFAMDGSWYIRDLASRTGTQVNGAPIHQQELKFGARIVVGSTTILFQPGAAKIDDPEDSFAPEIPAEIPDDVLADFDPTPFGAAAPVAEPIPVAGDEIDDAIPLEGERQFLNSPEPIPVEEAPVEVENIPVPATPDPMPVSADELDDVIPLGNDWRSAIAPEPIAEHELAAEVEPAPVPVAVEPKPIPVELTESADQIPLADEPVPAVIEAVDEAIPLADEEPVEDESVGAIVPAEPEVSAVHEPVAVVDELPVAEPVAVEAAVAPIETAVPTPRIEPSKPQLPAYERLLGDVEEFVFVPTAEVVEPNAVPDVIFWGDPELDSVAEQVVTRPAAPVVPPVEKDEQPPTDSEPPIDGGPSDPPPGPVSPSGSNASAIAPSAEDSQAPAPATPHEYTAVAELVAEPGGEPTAIGLHETAVMDLPSISAGSLRSEPLADLEEPIAETGDDFFMPMSEGLGAAFQAARTLMDALPDEPVLPFELSEPFEPDAGFGASLDLETSPVATAVDVMEPPVYADQGAIVPELDLGAVTAETHEPTDVSATINADLEIPEFAGEDHNGFHLPDLDSTTVAAPDPVEFSAVLNVDLDGPAEVVATTAGEPAAIGELELPELSGERPAPLSASEFIAQDFTLDEPEAAATAEARSAFDRQAVDFAVEESLSLGDISRLAFGDDVPFGDAVALELPTLTVTQVPAPVDLTTAELDVTECEAEAGPVGHAEATVTQTPPTIDFAGVVSADLELPVEESITVAPVEPEADAGVTTESDLEFLEFGEPEPEPIAEQAPVLRPREPKSPEPQPETPAASPAPRKGPSLFGFDFEGGSFLGGMPISLADKSAIPAPPRVPVPVVPSPTFDARATPPSGLGAMQAPPAAPAPVVPAPVVSLPVVPTPVVSPPMTPPRPIARPTVPPAVPRGAGSMVSLTGLISEARSLSGPPVIPPVVKAAPSPRPAGAVRGLTGAAPSPQGLGSRTVEVFSQLSAPIGVEVFGGRPGNPDQFIVPDIKQTTETQAVDEEVEQQTQPEAETGNQAVAARPARWSRVPLWVAMMILVPAAAWLVVPHVIQESSTFTGQLSFAGLKGQQPVDLHEFVKTQEALLCGSRSEEIRLNAREILKKDGLPAGFTEDAAQYGQTVQTQDLNWNENGQVEFTLHWPDQVMAKAQVDAVLLALAEKDRDLDVVKQRALVEADAAKANLAAVDATLAKLQTEYQALSEKASNRPDTLSVSQNQQDVISLTDRYNSAHATRLASESVLAELKAEDPTKPIDPDTDKEIVDYKKRLDLLNEQIRVEKSKGGVTATAGTGIGTDVSVGATTQPDSNSNFLLGAMQEQADLWSGKIQRRRDELAALAAIPADQRAVNLAGAIENLSIKINSLQKSEDDLKSQLDRAKTVAAQYQAQKEAADIAEVQKNEHYTEIQKATAEKQQAANLSAARETAYENCITVAGQTPARFVSVTNVRRTAVLVISILAWILFGRLTIGELLRPKLVTGVRPAAAPRVNPPTRAIPWPQPHQLQGLKSDGG